jgi:hypothetical protein
MPRRMGTASVRQRSSTPAWAAAPEARAGRLAQRPAVGKDQALVAEPSRELEAPDDNPNG